MKSLRKAVGFVKALVADPRVPDRDRAVIAAMLVYLASPVDLIPDFIPVLGHADDLVVVILLLDYVFHHLDRELLLEYWPWSEKALGRWERGVAVAAWSIPKRLRRRLWAPRRANRAMPETPLGGEGAS